MLTETLNSKFHIYTMTNIMQEPMVLWVMLLLKMRKSKYWTRQEDDWDWIMFIKTHSQMFISQKLYI